MRFRPSLVLSALILPLVWGCSRAPSSASKNSALLVWVNASDNVAPTSHYSEGTSGPYKVKAMTDVSLSSWIQNQRSVVTFGDRKVEIQFDKAQILVDDVVQAKLPPGT
jgi:hypothetical protein